MSGQGCCLDHTAVQASGEKQATTKGGMSTAKRGEGLEATTMPLEVPVKNGGVLRLHRDPMTITMAQAKSGTILITLIIIYS